MYVSLIDAAEDGDAGVTEDVRHLGFAKARSVIFKRELQLGIVDGETAKAVSVREFTERAQLCMSERRLQFKFGFEERHGKSIAESTKIFRMFE